MKLKNLIHSRAYNPKRTKPRYHRWTKSAIMCYDRNCNCQGCEMQELIESKCEMKATVLELVADYGIPKPEEREQAENEIQIDDFS